MNGTGTQERVRFGHGIVPARLGGLSFLLSTRALAVCAVLVGLCALVGVVSLAVGRYPLTIAEVLQALSGGAEGIQHTVVVEWRLPRAAAALLFGAALGVSGAIFQSLTRNPLGSPDIIGFASGSYTGALVVIILIGGGYLQVAAGALVGGCLTAALVYVLAYRGGVQGFRLIIVGIAVSAMLHALNTWMLIRASLEVALSAAVWGAGTLNGIGWSQMIPATAVLAVFFIAAAFLARPMRLLELGDDASRALGVRTERSRLSLVVLGVGLTATVTAAAGPISFISLAAPQIARRLTGSASVTMGASAVMGAFLLAAADFLAQHGFTLFLGRETTLPVGVMTVSIGGLYLIWLIIREARKGV